VDQRPPHKTKDTETYRGESGKGHQIYGHRGKFLIRTPMTCTVKSRINKQDLIILQTPCKAKDTVNKTKRQPTDLVRIFTNPKSDWELISSIYKDLKKLDSRKSYNPIKKCGTELKKELSTEEY
jgi:hypothetical protein